MDRIIKHVEINHDFGDGDGDDESEAEGARGTNGATVRLDVTIAESGEGYTLEWNGPRPDHCGDEWFDDLANAEHAAEERFGIGPQDWDTPEDW